MIFRAFDYLIFSNIFSFASLRAIASACVGACVRVRAWLAQVRSGELCEQGPSGQELRGAGGVCVCVCARVVRFFGLSRSLFSRSLFSLAILYMRLGFGCF